MGIFQITHTRKDGPDHDRTIDAVMVDGIVLNAQDVARSIARLEHSFFTEVRGIRATVFALRRGLGDFLYLTTSRDGFQPNNLLFLPDC